MKRKLTWIVVASTAVVGVLAAAAPLQSAAAATGISGGSASAANSSSRVRAGLAARAGQAAVSVALPDGPALVSSGIGRLELFSRTPGGELQERGFAAGGWGRPASLGGQRWVTGPAAAADQSGHMVVVIGGRGGTDYLRSGTAARWSRWVRLPGRGTSRPAVTSSGAGVFKIVRRNGDGTLSLGTWRAATGKFTGWSSLGGRLASAPSLTASKGSLTIIALGIGGRLEEMTVSQSGRHSPWVNLGGRWTGDPAITADPLTGELYQAVLGAGRSVHVRTGSARRWGAWQAVPGRWPASPALASAPGGLTVLAEQGSGALTYQAVLTGRRWAPFTQIIPLTVTKATKILRPGQVTAVTGAPSGRLTVTLSSGTPVPAAGVILALGVTAATPDGLLAKVTGTTAGPGGTTLATTEPASLPQAVGNGSINLSAALSAADVAPAADARTGSFPTALTPSQVMPQASSAAPPTLGQRISKNLACTGSASASVTGSVSVSPSFQLTAQWGLYSLRAAAFTGTVTADTQLIASVAAAASCTLNKTPLLDKPVVFDPITFDVGPVPVVIVPELQLYVTASGKVAAQLTDQADQRTSATAGLAWTGGTVSPIAGISATFSNASTAPAQRLTADLSASAGPGLSLLLYGAEGPQLTATASAALHVAPAATPWWTLTGAFDAGAELKIPQLGINRSDDHIIHFQKILAQASTTPPAQPGGSLNAVAAISAGDAWAVGNAFNTSIDSALIEHWNGTAWQQVPNPDSDSDSGLYGVAAISATGAWAVGNTGQSSTAKTLTEHWNGSAWTLVASPSPPGGGFLAVAATSAANAWAVGDYEGSQSQEPFIEHWNGSAWTQVPSVTPAAGGSLSGVTATSASNAWAVGATGSGQPLIEHWNGTAWSQVPSPAPGNLGAFSAVAATSAGNAWAVGVTPSNNQALIEHWNGTAWTQVPAPAIAGGSYLFNVAATSASNVWAVGTIGLSRGTTLIEHWNGTAWTQVNSPNPSPGEDSLYGIATTSPANAWAVGITGNGTPNPSPLIVHWDGTTWK